MNKPFLEMTLEELIENREAFAEIPSHDIIQICRSKGIKLNDVFGYHPTDRSEANLIKLLNKGKITESQFARYLNLSIIEARTLRENYQ